MSYVCGRTLGPQTCQPSPQSVSHSITTDTSCLHCGSSSGYNLFFRQIPSLAPSAFVLSTAFGLISASSSGVYWIIDSGSLFHMTGTTSLVSTIEHHVQMPIVHTARGFPLTVLQCCYVTPASDLSDRLRLHGVFHSPNLCINLSSISALHDLNLLFHLMVPHALYEIHAQASRLDLIVGLVHFTIWTYLHTLAPPPPLSFCGIVSLETGLWHKYLGHVHES